jgi:hypothetical protein
MRSKIWPLILILSLGLGFAGCGDDDSETTPEPETTGTVSGVVTDLNGAVMSDVDVWINAGTPVQTNEQGYFVMSNVVTGNVVVSFAAVGHVSTFRNVTVLSTQTTHLPQVSLMEAQAEVIASADGGTLDAGGVAEVIFPPDAFVNENGTAYTGDVNVELAAMQPQAEGFFEAFPGEFEGLREDGTTVPFVSFGIIDVNLMNADKSAPVRLAPGVTAELRMDIVVSQKASAPATIPMWYYDPDTGRWIEDGSATLEGNTYVTDVDHFTTWNWDVPLEDVCQIEGVVQDLDGNPVADARVFSRGMQSGIMDEAYTTAAGAFNVRGIADEAFQLWAMKGSYASAVTQVTLTECPYTLTAVLELLEPAFSITLRWGAAPSDLDSHLLIPATWTEDPDDVFHLYFGNMGDLADDPYTQLDTDDVSSFGPEVVSSFHFYMGTYSYYIYNYSNNGSIAASEASVTAEIAGESHTYLASTATGQGDPRYWHVFDFTVDLGGVVTVTDRNVWGLPAKAAGLPMVQKH